MGIPFALQIIIIVCMVLGAHCCSYSGGGGLRCLMLVMNLSDDTF